MSDLPGLYPEDCANVLRASGYFRISHKFRGIARVDRPGPCQYGPDHYRRCSSKDKVDGIWYVVFKLLDSSNLGPDVGFLPLHPRTAEVLEYCKKMGAEERERYRAKWKLKQQKETR